MPTFSSYPDESKKLAAAKAIVEAYPNLKKKGSAFGHVSKINSLYCNDSLGEVNHIDHVTSTASHLYELNQYAWLKKGCL